MITINGVPLEKTRFHFDEATGKRGAEIELWAKEACDRIFSHYSEQEMELMRKQNAR